MMEILNRFRSKQTTVGAESMVALTEDGKRAVDKMMVEGKTFPVMMALDEHSPRSVSDLSRECRMDIHQMKRMVSKLEHQRMVRILD